MILPNGILRSVLRIGDEDEQLLSANLYQIEREFAPDGVDGLIVRFAHSVATRARQVPTLAQVRQHFQKEADKGDGAAQAAVARLGDIQPSQPFLAGAEFRIALDAFRDQFLTTGLGDLLVESSTVLTTGITQQVRNAKGKFEPVTFRGPDAAMNYLQQGLSRLRAKARVNGESEGDIRNEKEKLKDYIVKMQERQTGVMSGISKIDEAHRGIKPGELALVMGYTGHMKSTFCANWLYHAAVYQGRNVVVVPMETQVDVLRTTLFVMHAAHEKFSDRRGTTQIDYTKLETGTLSDREFEFFEEVVEDLATCKDYGRILYKDPQAGATIADVQAWAEMKDLETPLSLIMIDYLGLLDPEKNVSGLEQNSNLNRVIRQAKQMAMTFAGRGIAVLSPHQANREGYKEAQKNGGRYELTALANANEAERSSDLIYSIYIDDTLRTTCEAVLGNLKTRNVRKITDVWRVSANPATRRICDQDPMDRAMGLVEL